ncbi:hypothetical protein [Tritonibacter scottomollicae]|uniref:hypothetical protein n=1 Tax=Tritonibacter scottomollicae TaxID=483013 RepID=UPI003AA8F03B
MSNAVTAQTATSYSGIDYTNAVPISAKTAPLWPESNVASLCARRGAAPTGEAARQDRAKKSKPLRPHPRTPNNHEPLHSTHAQVGREELMARKQQFTAAQIQRFINAARTTDPKAVVEIVTEAGTVRFLPESEHPPDPASPFDKWKTKRHASETKGH